MSNIFLTISNYIELERFGGRRHSQFSSCDLPPLTASCKQQFPLFATQEFVEK